MKQWLLALDDAAFQSWIDACSLWQQDGQDGQGLQSLFVTEQQPDSLRTVPQELEDIVKVVLQQWQQV